MAIVAAIEVKARTEMHIVFTQTQVDINRHKANTDVKRLGYRNDGSNRVCFQIKGLL